MRKKQSVICVLLLSVCVIAVVLKIGSVVESEEQKEKIIPVLSAGSGFYEEPFDLILTTAEDATVYYTLDGSTPDENALLYTEPIRINYKEAGAVTTVKNMLTDWQDEEGESHSDCATVLRAVAVSETGEMGEIVTATYFVGTRPFPGKMLVSLVADPEDLFGENGIYVTGGEYDAWYLNGKQGEEPVPNFYRSGREWERAAVLELFEEESILQQPVGIRIQGASARDGANKRFSVYARKEYSGSPWFDIPLFGKERSHSFVLRSGFMNGYIQHLVQDRDVAAADSREVVVYLNGSLWYITIMQEKYSEKYFQERYGVDADNVVIVKGGTAESDGEGDQALYQQIYDFLQQNDLADQAVYNQFKQLMDIQSYIDFCCVNLYFGNLDYSEYKNCLCWRARQNGNGEYEDGKWRWALFDLDLENLNYGVLPEEINTFTMDTHYAGSAFNTRTMYVALKRNEEFRRQFVLSFMDMVNTDFSVNHATEAMQNWDITMEWWGMQPDWMESYFPARTKAITDYMAEEFELQGTCEEVTLSVNDMQAGTVTINTIKPELVEGKWCGEYFTDYPVTVTAVARKGYSFVGWECDSLAEENKDESTITLNIPTGGVNLRAIFQKE